MMLKRQAKHKSPSTACSRSFLELKPKKMMTVVIMERECIWGTVLVGGGKKSKGKDTER
jgi:hypothetical protein